jgi:two-component system cell cycle sensor histidine kinase/response regulator CckA
MGQDRKASGGTPKLREKAEARLQSETPGVQDYSLEEMNVLIHELQVHQIELEMQNDALRQSQISLEEANRKYSDFYDFAPVGFLTLNESGLIREVNLTAASQLGVTRRHLVDKPFRFFIEVEDRKRFHLYLKRVFREPGPQPGEIKLHRPDGGSFFARLNSVAVTDVSDARVCRTSITNISDLKEAERKLQASERLFASFVGHLPSVAVIRDLEGRCLFANAAWEQAFQKNRGQWLEKTSEELWPPEVAAKFREQDRLVIETGEALQTLGSLRHPDGLHQWISHRFPIVDQDGHTVMIGINAIDVTEPMATKARLEQVLDSSPAAIYTCDPGRDFALSYISENIKAVVGWEAREFLADSHFWLQHVHPEDRSRVSQRFKSPWPEDRQTFEYRFLTKDGDYRWIHDEVRLVRDADGKPLEMAGLWVDITESKRMEEALRVSLRFLELVHNFTDINSLLTAFVSEIKNYTACEAVGIRVLDAAGGIPYQAYDGFRPQFFESENPLSIRTDQCMCTNVIKGDCNPTLPFYTAGGSFWMNQTTRFLAAASEQDQWRTRNVCNLEGYESVAMIPIRWGDQILGLIHIADRRENMVPLKLVEVLEKAALQLGTALERVRGEQALRESEAKYRLLVNQIPAVVFKGYRDWSVDFFDRKIEHLTGYSKAEFDSRQITWLDLILPEDRGMASGLFKQALKADKSYVREYRIRKKDGEIAWIQAQGQIFTDAAGQVDYVSGVFFDITARKEAETIIHQERHRFFSLLDMLPALVCLVAPDFSVPFANRQFREIFGDPQGRSCHDLSYDRQTPCDECHIREILETRKPVEWERTTPQGRTYHIYNYPFADIDGSPMVLKLGIDITERKALEAQLLQAQKMEAVGRLAGGVAHDFNNLLMAIMGYSELIRTNLIKDDPLYKYSEDILKATERAASLTQQLLAFSRQQVMQPQVLNLNRVASELEKMLRRLIGEHIEMEIVAGPDLGMIKADPGQIGQIIMNLAVNARDAMPTGGRLILATDNVEFTATHQCRFENIAPGRYVRLTVTDTGSGMGAETLAHIFEPFFTTKEVGKGTGLGLPMVYGIVKQNGGCVDVESHPGQGATFKIYLPRLDASVEAPGARVSLSAKLEGSETILVVEDEDALRTLLCRFFRLYGYNVLEARHGGEALLICERHPGRIHLMITDVVMPQMSGKELAERLAQLHPEMTVFFMSGYTGSDLTGYGAPETNNHFIAKPFRPMDLVKKVRDSLDAAREGSIDSNQGSKR